MQSLRDNIDTQAVQETITVTLKHIDDFTQKIDNTFKKIWESYKLDINEFVDSYEKVLKDYQEFWQKAAQSLELGLGAIVEAINVWLKTRKSGVETIKKIGKWGAIALGIVGVVATGYSIYQIYKSEKKIGELKERLKKNLENLRKEKEKLINLKVQHLKDLSEYIFFFKETTISIIDILYAIGNFRLEQNFVNNELFPRLDRVMLYFFKFEFILQTIDFLDKNRKLFASIAFLNPGIFLYIKENT